MTTYRSLPPALTVRQAAEQSPSLARLTDLVRESSDRLQAVQSLIPETLRASVKAGPIDNDSWCLLVSGNAAAAKLRQILPLLQARLQREGWKVNSIRLKILTRPK
ncbi:hypothetical protein [Polaromonas sp. YR568]|uniref:hypothetical protein n=1 Tax=Polaromonas sp. YR568 TaxID=1855301 RepID=UPI00313791B9